MEQKGRASLCTVLTMNHRHPTAMEVGYDHVVFKDVMNLHWLILRWGELIGINKKPRRVIEAL